MHVDRTREGTMCKVDSLIEKHDLSLSDPSYDSVEDYLASRWVGSDGRSPQGYRTLADWFNERVLAAIYEAAGRSTVSVHLEGEYELVTGNDSLDRAELAADLAADGLDIDDIARDMISGSTMHNHLRNCTDVEKAERQSESTSQWQLGEFDVARELAKSKVDDTLASLASTGRLPRADESEVTVDVKLSCPDCSTRVPFDVAVERGYICPTHSPDGPDEPDVDDGETSASVTDADVDSSSHSILGIGAALSLSHLTVLALHVTSSHGTAVIDAVSSAGF